MSEPLRAQLKPFRPVPFGRYTLLSPLSSGGMGELFLARLDEAGFEKLCVIKKIRESFATERDFLERFVNEAKTLVRLSHGSIAQVLDMGLHGDEPYLALEYVDGKDLRKVATRMRERKTRMPLPVSLYVMGRVLDALAYAHRKRDDDERELSLVHRDISPQNILLSYEGDVKVIDFGLAKSTLNIHKTHPSIVVGKLLYMAPEQVRNQTVDRRSDLYSVGICLYELVAGTNPFESLGMSDLVERVAHPKIPPLRSVAPDCPASVEALVKRAIDPDPAARFQTAEEFRGRLLACLVEVDSFAGSESVSSHMRDSFAFEFEAERRLLRSFRERLPGEMGAASAATTLITSQSAIDAEFEASHPTVPWAVPTPSEGHPGLEDTLPGVDFASSAPTSVEVMVWKDPKAEQRSARPPSRVWKPILSALGIALVSGLGFAVGSAWRNALPVEPAPVVLVIESEELLALRAAWERTSMAFHQFAQTQGCHTPETAVLCARYAELKQKVESAPNEPGVYGPLTIHVHEFHRAIEDQGL